MEFKGCGILLTENCNARCKMCCDSRGLVRGKTLTIEELDLILKNIKECPSYRSHWCDWAVNLCYILIW